MAEPFKYEWKQLARSIRFEYNGYTADVWPVSNAMGTRRYKWTVLHDETGMYVDSGEMKQLDDACEKCERIIRF